MFQGVLKKPLDDTVDTVAIPTAPQGAAEGASRPPPPEARENRSRKEDLFFVCGKRRQINNHGMAGFHPLH